MSCHSGTDFPVHQSEVENPLPRLVLGPIQRFVDETEATIWVETDRACEVRVLGQSSPTFCVAGHHYGLVIIEGLEPGTSHPYSVELDGQVVWPSVGEPEGVIRTASEDSEFRLAFGSCRVAVPHEPPYAHGRDRSPKHGKGVDALRALQARMARQGQEDWPDALMLVGDQVYADEVSPDVKEEIANRRDINEGAGEEIADFEEYTWLYRESWSPEIERWLFSTVPSAMIFDDHDMIDDWNISAAWVRDIRRQPWWEDHVVGGLVSFWIYDMPSLRRKAAITSGILVFDAVCLVVFGGVLHWI